MGSVPVPETQSTVHFEEEEEEEELFSKLLSSDRMRDLLFLEGRKRGGLEFGNLFGVDKENLGGGGAAVDIWGMAGNGGRWYCGVVSCVRIGDDS